MDVKSELRNFIVENFLFGSTETPLGDNDSFMQKGILDSTGILEVVSFIEEKFGIAVEDDDLIPENLDSIDNIAAFVARKSSAKV